MTDTKQPEALRLAEILEGDYCPDWFYEQGVDEVAAELRRLHAENATLQQGYDAARLEIDGLHARVQELGAMLRENRSKRIVALETENLGLLHALAAEQDANTDLRQQLEAIGAGGVEPLRKRPRQIEHDHFRDATKMVIAQSAPAAAPAPHPAPVAQGDALDAAFEAVRQRLCELQRYSFVLDDDGVVRRVKYRFGNWIEFDDAHALFDPVAVDAARAQAKEGASHE